MLIKTDGKGNLELDLDVIVEKAKTPEGKTEVQNAIKGIKGFSGDEFTSVLNNHKESIKESLMKENKIEAARVREKSLKDKYKMTHLEEGKDYKSTEELVALILAEQVKSAKPGDTDKEIEKRDTRIAELTKQLETDYVKKSDYENVVNTGLKNFIDAEIATYADKLDEANGEISNQLKFLRFTMAEAGISFGLHKGEYAVFGKDGKVIEGADIKPVSVKTVIKE